MKVRIRCKSGFGTNLVYTVNRDTDISRYVIWQSLIRPCWRECSNEPGEGKYIQQVVMNLSTTKGRTKSEKKIGGTTSLTIPKEFTNSITGEIIQVTNKHLDLLNSPTSRGELTSLLMTGLHLLNQINNPEETPLPIRSELSALRSDISGIHVQMKALTDYMLFLTSRADQN